MAVPNTDDFSLQHVVNEINPTTDDLQDCVDDADSSSYDTTYYTSPATSLLEFRNYAVAIFTLKTTSTRSNWSPSSVTTSSGTLTWNVSGDISTSQYVSDDPTIDLSSNTGEVIMNILGSGNIEELYFRLTHGDKISEISIENISTLQILLITNQDIASLDVSKNINLQTLYCYQNDNMSALDITNNINLTGFNAELCNLTTIDTSNNTALTWMRCNSNLLTSVDVSDNTLLTSLNVGNNSLTGVDVSDNTSLVVLDVSNNSGITNIDISNNPLLRTVEVQYCNIVSGDIDNILIHLNSEGLLDGTVDVRGNQDRTTASDAARTSLISKGWSVID